MSRTTSRKSGGQIRRISTNGSCGPRAAFQCWKRKEPSRPRASRSSWSRKLLQMVVLAWTRARIRSRASSTQICRRPNQKAAFIYTIKVTLFTTTITLRSKKTAASFSTIQFLPSHLEKKTKYHRISTARFIALVETVRWSSHCRSTIRLHVTTILSSLDPRSLHFTTRLDTIRPAWSTTRVPPIQYPSASKSRTLI